MKKLAAVTLTSLFLAGCWSPSLGGGTNSTLVTVIKDPNDPCGFTMSKEGHEETYHATVDGCKEERRQ
jgi:uncharacterized protein YcfL